MSYKTCYIWPNFCVVKRQTDSITAGCGVMRHATARLHCIALAVINLPDAVWQRHTATGSCVSLTRRRRQAGKLIGYDPLYMYDLMPAKFITVPRHIQNFIPILSHEYAENKHIVEIPCLS
jgi:hypothetical protein